MARLRQLEAAIKKVGMRRFLVRIYTRIWNDNILVWASALAYSWLFSLFPFLIFALSLMPYLPGGIKRGAEARLHSTVMQLPPQASDAVWGALKPVVHRLLEQPPRGLLSVGLIVVLWAASSGMSMTMYAMDRCWNVTVHRSYVRQRAMAIILTIVEAALILCVLILLPIGTLITHWIMTHLDTVADFFTKQTTSQFAVVPTFIAHHPEIVLLTWEIIRYAVAILLMLTATAIVYHFGPNIKRPIRWLTPGSVFTIAVWLILGVLFRLYVDYFGKTYEMYGTVGGVAILLLFFYIDGTVLLIGSEINAQIEEIVNVTALPEQQPKIDQPHGTA